MLVPGDPLAHRALDSLLRAEARVRRRLSADLEREGPERVGLLASSSCSPPPAASSSCARCACACAPRRRTRPRSSATLVSRGLVIRSAPGARPPRRDRPPHTARAGDRRPAVPRAHRARGGDVRRPRRGREAGVHRDLPEARRPELKVSATRKPADAPTLAMDNSVAIQLQAMQLNYARDRIAQAQAEQPPALLQPGQTAPAPVPEVDPRPVGRRSAAAHLR